jgi:hypothetical protein
VVGVGRRRPLSADVLKKRCLLPVQASCPWLVSRVQLIRAMTSAPAILSIDDLPAWRAETLPQIDVKLRTCIYDSDWLKDAPSAFDTQHLEKRAVIFERKLVRLWSRRYESDSKTVVAPFYAVTEGVS